MSDLYPVNHVSSGGILHAQRLIDQDDLTHAEVPLRIQSAIMTVSGFSTAQGQFNDLIVLYSLRDVPLGQEIRATIRVEYSKDRGGTFDLVADRTHMVPTRSSQQISVRLPAPGFQFDLRNLHVRVTVYSTADTAYSLNLQTIKVQSEQMDRPQQIPIATYVGEWLAEMDARLQEIEPYLNHVEWLAGSYEQEGSSTISTTQGVLFTTTVTQNVGKSKVTIHFQRRNRPLARGPNDDAPGLQRIQ